MIFFLFFAVIYIRNRNINAENKNIIVTGASSNHELSLIQFIYHCFNSEMNVILVIWDLGLSNYFLKLIVSILKFNRFIIYKKFNYSNYPSYFNIDRNQGVYAWKPIIIKNTFNMMKRTILWLDAGCVITSRLDIVFADINKYHCWSTNTDGNIKKWTYIGMIKYYNITYNITNRRMCNGAIVGFKWNSKISTNILNDWVNCAYKIDCIAPNGSSVKNHRQDQSALSILIYKYNIFNNCPDNTKKIKTHKDLQNIINAEKLYKKILELKINYH